MNKHKRFKPRSNNNLNDKLLNLSVLFFTTNLIIGFTLYSPLSFFGSIISSGLLLYMVSFTILHLTVEIYGVKLSRKMILAGLYGLIFAFISQLPTYYAILQQSSAGFYATLKYPLLTNLVAISIYVTSSYASIYIYKIVKSKVKDYLIVRHTIAILWAHIFIIGIYYATSNVFSFGIGSSILTEVYVRLPLLVIQLILLYPLSSWLVVKNNFTPNRNYYNNKPKKINNFNNSNVKGDVNEKHNAVNAKSSGNAKKHGEPKKRD